MSDVPDRVDCLQFPSDDDGEVRVVPVGTGERIVAAHREEARRRRRVGAIAVVVAALLTAAGAVLLIGPTVEAAAGTVLVALVLGVAARRGGRVLLPELVASDLPLAEARDRYEVVAATADPIADGVDGPAGGG